VPDLNPDELQRLARLGAEARLKELRSEEAAIRRAFPDAFRTRRSSSNMAEHAAAAPARRRRKRSRMSAAARKAASERMKNYWAERRRSG